MVPSRDNMYFVRLHFSFYFALFFYEQESVKQVNIARVIHIYPLGVNGTGKFSLH